MIRFKGVLYLLHRLVLASSCDLGLVFSNFITSKLLVIEALAATARPSISWIASATVLITI